MAKKTYFFFILLSFLLSSCETSNETDQSLTLEEYEQLGMPDYRHVWNMDDYSSAFYVLNSLKYERPRALPARDSEKSGLLFSRMVSLDNLSFLHDVTLPLHAKADLIKWFVNTLMELKVAYTLPAAQDQYYIRELIDVDIFRLQVSHKMLDLGQQINASDDPSDSVMASDYPQIQQMYLNLLEELLAIEQYLPKIPVQTMELLSESLSSSVQGNMHWFDEDATGQVRLAVQAAIDNASDRNIAENYRELLEILQGLRR